MKRTNHTSCKKGKYVRIKLVNGGVIIDKFVETKSGVIYLEKCGRLLKEEIKSFSIYKRQ